MEQPTTTQDYLEGLEVELSPDPFTEKLRNDLKQMLGSKCLRLAFQHVMSESFAMITQVASVDLSDPKGVSEAIKLQGKVEGLQRALDVIFECSIDPDAEPEPEPGE